MSKPGWEGAENICDSNYGEPETNDLSEYAEKTLTFLQDSGLTEEEAAFVCAAVLCALSENSEVAHKMVDYVEYQTSLAAGGEMDD
jgi:hypothetical protein